MISRRPITLSIFAATALILSAVLGSSSAAATNANVSVGTGSGTITYHAHRIQASNWDPCFATTCDAGTGPGATMYFVVYDSTGKIVGHGFADETGTQITGLNVGSSYSIYPADCNLCHNSTHNVVFDHWGDNSNVRPRTFVAQSSPVSVDAYYKIVELGSSAQQPPTPSPPAVNGTSISSTPGTAVQTQPPAIAAANTGTIVTSVSTITIQNEKVIVIKHGKDIFEAPLVFVALTSGDDQQSNIMRLLSQNFENSHGHVEKLKLKHNQASKHQDHEESDED